MSSVPAPQGVAFSGRCFLRFRDDKRRGAAAAMFSNSNIYFSKFDSRLLLAESTPEAAVELPDDVEIIPSRQYDFLKERIPLDQIYQPVEFHPRNLNHVLTHIQADAAWPMANGNGVHIAIVDTGVAVMPEFPAWKRSPLQWSYRGSAWTDLEGHGSMVACIAAGTRRNGGRYDGVAPGANIISCKTGYDDLDLYRIYDHLIRLVETKQIGRLVINNSYGLYACSPPDYRPDDPVVAIIRGAVERGIVVVFAAGNNHVHVCGNHPLSCGPNSIWGLNSLDEVISVGTVDENNRMDQPPDTPNAFSHRDSSRGPGQLASKRSKPDCVAPTYGEVMWGSGYSSMQWWGTSGAAPQVAGLAALILEKRPELTPEEVRTVICESCIRLPLDPKCTGYGLINCAEALRAIS